MSSHVRTLKASAQALIEATSACASDDMVALRQLAITARTMAREAGDPVLEAEALLRLNRSRTPQIDPQYSLSAMQVAECIFRANGMQQKAGACCVARAQALLDVGQERNAIAMAQAAMQTAPLIAEDRVHASMVIAMGHMLLGEMDAALHGLGKQALPLALASEQPELVARVKCYLGLAYLYTASYRQLPALWHGLPGWSGVSASALSPDAIFKMFDGAQAALPSGQAWRYIGLYQQFALGIMGDDDKAPKAFALLAQERLASDPPFAARALYGKGYLLHAQGEFEAARDTMAMALQVAQSAGAMGIARMALLQLSRIHEALGDSAQALACYKRFSDMYVRGMVLNTAATALALPNGVSAMHSSPEPSAHRLRNLEPVHVKHALQFIEAKIGDNISVNDVVRYCGVSRRTLETAFRDSKATTIADYTKHRKMAHAALALQHTGQSVQHIALSVGYGSPATFSREFRASFGAPPSRWRNALKASPGPPGA